MNRSTDAEFDVMAEQVTDKKGLHSPKLRPKVESEGE